MINYDIIESRDKSQFIRTVNERLSCGWKPLGGISVCYDSNTSTTSNAVVYVQAIYKGEIK